MPTLPASSSHRTGSGLQAFLARLALLALVGVLALVGACDRKAPPQEGRVAAVLDGDSLRLEGGAEVRVLGIDAPELGKGKHPPEFLAREAQEALAGLTQGNKVRLEYDRQRYDRFGRLLAHVFTSDGTHVNVELVRRGLARVYLHPPNFRFKEELLRAQKEALEAQRGLWSRPLRQDEPSYLAHRTNFRVHRPGCRLAAGMAPANRLKITSLKEAYLMGYSPCRSCKP